MKRCEEIASSGLSVTQGRGCGTHPGGVEAPGPCSEEPVKRCEMEKCICLISMGLGPSLPGMKQCSWGRKDRAAQTGDLPERAAALARDYSAELQSRAEESRKEQVLNWSTRSHF
ncbi:uncharacterized protein LOC143681162 isoform X5 [Tamandua tetradactyla]|uniref:uncharacterized protein LOC143681162 isoform X5 n=1 Tax=Tamandua tetradactyla TaxID=48850 RepID=UPI00405397C2